MQGAYRGGQLVAVGEALCGEVERERPICFCVNAGVGNVRLGQRAQVDRAVDAAEEPPVGAPFGVVYRAVVRLFLHRHLERVLASVIYQPAYVVGESREGPAVGGPGCLAVDAHRGVGHHAVEHYLYLLALPCGRHAELVAVAPCLGAGLAARFLVPPAVGVFAESLLLPARGHGYLAPLAAVLACRAEEFPLDGGRRVAARKILYFSVLGCCHGAAAQQ